MGVPILTGVLRLKDETTGTLRNAMRRITSGIGGVAKIAAGFLVRDVAQGLVRVGKESVALGAKMETLSTSFEALRGSELDQSLDNLRDAVGGTVSDLDLLTAANQAMALGLPTEELDELFASAQKVGAAMGRTTLQAVQDLTTGIGRQSRLILDNLGIIVETEKAHEEYAKAIGKTTSELTDQERKTAFVTAAIEELNRKASILGDNISEVQLKHEQFTAAITNMKTQIGTALIPIISDLAKTFTDDLLPPLTELIDLFRKRDFITIGNKIKEVFTTALNRVTSYIQSIDWMGIWNEIVTIATAEFKKIQARITEVFNSIDWPGVWDSLIKFVTDLWATHIKPAIGNIGDQFKELLPKTNEDWKAVWQSLFDFAETMWSKYVVPLWSEAMDVLFSFLPSSTEEWANVWHMLWTFGEELWTRLVTAAGNIAAAFTTHVNTTNWEPLRTALDETLGQLIRDVIKTAWQSGWSFLTDVSAWGLPGIAGRLPQILEEEGLIPSPTGGVGPDGGYRPAAYSGGRGPTFVGPRPLNVTIAVENFIGLNRSAAKTLAKVTAEEFLRELRRKGIR